MATQPRIHPRPLPVLLPSQQRPADNTARELASELRRPIKGEVRFDEGSRSLYATDLSIYRQVPIGVVLPRGDRSRNLPAATPCILRR